MSPSSEATDGARRRLGYIVRQPEPTPAPAKPPDVVLPWVLDVSKPIAIIFLILCNTLFVVAWDDTALVLASVVGGLGIFGAIHLSGLRGELQTLAAPCLRVTALINLAVFVSGLVVVTLALLGLV